MKIKKLLPTLFIVLIIAGVILQPGVANPAQEPTNNEILKPADVITVCSDGSCNHTTIQGAINAAFDGDTIQLSSETFTEALDFSPTVPKAITISGNGSENTIIQAHANSGSATDRVIAVGSQASLTLNGVTVQHGNINSDNGGGIRNRGSLTVTNCLITDNSTGLGGGGIANIPNPNEQVTLVISNTTISNNYADDQGGGIFNSAINSNSTINTTIRNSAIITNTAWESGGGIANIATHNDSVASAVLDIYNVTLSDNFAEDGVGGGIYNAQGGDDEAMITIRQATLRDNIALYSGDQFYVESGDISIKSSILAGEYRDCAGVFTDGGYNLVENASCGTPIGRNLGMDLNLSDNGGNTPTYALYYYSPALDIIPPDQCEEVTDQRGVVRPFGAGCDIGAFELDENSLELEQSVVDANVQPGEVISFTITAKLTGPGISNGILKTNEPEYLIISETVKLDPPDSGIISTPPTMTHSIVISANHMLTVTMYAEVAMGLPQETKINHEVSLSSYEIAVPEMALVQLNVVNAPPVAVDDSGAGFITDPNTVFVTGNILDNDYDPNNDPLTYSGLNSEVDPRGSVEYNGDGTFTYDPDHQFDEMIPGQTYYDTFQYKIIDDSGGFSDWATVTVIIRKEESDVFLPIIMKE